MKPRTLLLAVLAAAALAGGAITAYRTLAPPPVLETATPLQPAERLPAFALLDQSGRSIGPEALEGHWNLVFFGFTHCPDVCPLTLQTLADARRRLAERGHDPLPRLVLVSVDPERDTPDSLRDYVDHFGDGNLGMTGDLDAVRALARSLGIFFERRVLDGGDYTVDHSAVVLVVNPRAELVALFSSPHDAATIAHDLPILMRR